MSPGNSAEMGCNNTQQFIVPRISAVSKTFAGIAEVANLHDALEQLAPISEKHGIIGAAGMTALIKQHKDVLQQIAEAKQQVAKLELVADLEGRQTHFEACLSAGES